MTPAFELSILYMLTALAVGVGMAVSLQSILVGPFVSGALVFEPLVFEHGGHHVKKKCSSCAKLAAPTV
jgi:hypothetical protein